MSTHTALLAAVATLAAGPALAEEAAVEPTAPESSVAEAVTAAAITAVATPIAAVVPVTSWWQTRPTPEPDVEASQEVEVDLQVISLDHCPPCGRG